MPPKVQVQEAQVQSETNVVVDRDARTILLTRMFAAPREQIFEAWTRPEHVACWWDPTGARLTECVIDLRPGGAFRFVNQGSSHAPPFSGIYREIAPPEQLVFDAMGSIGRVILKDVGGKTLMTVTIECGSTAQLDQFLKLGVDVGTSQTLDNLVAYIGTKRP
jgi:uncharacterized protein YndB with AHSA1/START domain